LTPLAVCGGGLNEVYLDIVMIVIVGAPIAR
jgi:hypothetical protein